MGHVDLVTLNIAVAGDLERGGGRVKRSAVDDLLLEPDDLDGEDVSRDGGLVDQHNLGKLERGVGCNVADVDHITCRGGLELEGIGVDDVHKIGRLGCEPGDAGATSNGIQRDHAAVDEAVVGEREEVGVLVYACRQEFDGAADR